MKGDRQCGMQFLNYIHQEKQMKWKSQKIIKKEEKQKRKKVNRKRTKIIKGIENSNLPRLEMWKRKFYAFNKKKNSTIMETCLRAAFGSMSI